MQSGLQPRRRGSARAAAAALLLTGASALAGCSQVIVDHLPTAMGGLPQNAPSRPTPAAYPAVHDVPASNRETVLSEAERKRLRDDLVATRERAARDAAVNPDASPAGTPASP